MGTITRAGMVRVEPPWRVAAMARAMLRSGPLAGAITAAAGRHGDRTALVDDRGSVTFADLERRSNALARAWRDRGIGDGTGVGILCRNHRGFVDATLACAKVGARALYLNTDFAAPQAREVSARERVEALVFDEEFAAVVAAVEARRGRFLAWIDTSAEEPTLEALIADGDPSPPPAPPHPGTVVILTSGTTGTPKGAPRPAPRSLAGLGALLSKIPLRAGDAVSVAPPMFHAWGLANAALALGMGSTVVMRRRFDPERLLDDLAEHGCAALVVVPVMLQRLLALGDDTVRGRDLSALRIIAASGAQLDGALATRVMDVFGDRLYNLYGSTEVAYATIAAPEDLRAAPGCAGRPPFGTVVKLFDERGREVPVGQTGRIFVGNPYQFSGYTGGGTKDVIDGLMATGDVGHFDDGGRLFVDGRDDEMIVSGGENVFPREVEELLATHAAIADAAAIGVPDEQFGARLRAFVVLRRGQNLTADEVQSFVRDNLARYKVPRDVVFLDELPRNPTGKVLKRELAAMDDGGPTGGSSESGGV